MTAALLKETNTELVFEELQIDEIAAGEVLLKVHFAALNHRDVWIQQGKYGKIKLPCVLGSDAFGEVIEVADDSDKLWLNKEVIINPNIDWGNDERFQSGSYQILGMPKNGSFSTHLKVKAKQLSMAPLHLSPQEAAALPLAGLTAFRALIKKAQANSNDKVLINGIGGGVAQMAFQMALALGCETYVTSSSEEKLNKALQLGAKGGFNYKSPDWIKEAAIIGGFDVIIDSAGGRAFNNLLKVAGMGCRIAIYGGTAGNIDGLSPQILFWKQIQIFGTTMGSDNDFIEMVSFVEKTKMPVIVDKVFQFKEVNDAFKYMAKQQQMGKIVLQVKQ